MIIDSVLNGDMNQAGAQQDDNQTRESDNRFLINLVSLIGIENAVDYLITTGSPVDSVDNNNFTPLILSASAGQYEVVRCLVAHGANVNHKTNRDLTALHYATSKGHREVVKFLIDAGSNVNAADLLGTTPLHKAAAQGKADIVRILLSSPQINVNAQDSKGCTPLHLACKKDKDLVAILLVKAGAQFDLKNKEGKTPLDMCPPKLQCFYKACILTDKFSIDV